MKDLAAPAADTAHDLRDEAALSGVYAPGPAGASLAKVADHVHPLYRPWIEASPFAVLATLGPQGLDTSPRGDAPGFVTVVDEHTLLLPPGTVARPFSVRPTAPIQPGVAPPRREALSMRAETATRC